jgi:hypothetical protein
LIGYFFSKGKFPTFLQEFQRLLGDEEGRYNRKPKEYFLYYFLKYAEPPKNFIRPAQLLLNREYEEFLQ